MGIYWNKIHQLLLFSMILFLLFLSSSCKLEEMGDITIQPANIVAGMDNVVLQVSSQSIPQGASIRINNQIYPTQTITTNRLSCTLPRDLTLPQNPLASKWTVSVDLVNASGTPLSTATELTFQRDYVWSPAEKIANQGTDSIMSIHQSGSNSLFLLFRSGVVIYQMQSQDGGITWQTPVNVFTLMTSLDSYSLLVYGEQIFIVAKESGALTLYQLTPGQTPSLSWPVPNTEICDGFKAVIDDSGCIHLIWDVHTDESHNLIWYSRSHIDGHPWSNPSEVLHDEGYWPTYSGISGLAAYGDHVFVSYIQNTGRYQFNVGRISFNQGQTWQDGTALDSNRTLFCGNGVILKYDKYMYLPYMYCPTIIRSEDWGITWKSVFSPENDEYSDVDWIVSDPWGNLLAALSLSAGETKIMLRSFDQGNNWIIPAGNDINLPDSSTKTVAMINEDGTALILSSPGSSDGIWISRARPKY